MKTRSLITHNEILQTSVGVAGLAVGGGAAEQDASVAFSSANAGGLVGAVTAMKLARLTSWR
jgi:hypothetical protein